MVRRVLSRSNSPRSVRLKLTSSPKLVGLGLQYAIQIEMRVVAARRSGSRRPLVLQVEARKCETKGFRPLRR